MSKSMRQRIADRLPALLLNRRDAELVRCCLRRLIDGRGKCPVAFARKALAAMRAEQ